LVPDGKAGNDAFAVIRETIRNKDMVAIGRVILTSREHIIALEPLGNGLTGTLLRYPYEGMGMLLEADRATGGCF
jgi:DNA end-binding protein Ku